MRGKAILIVLIALLSAASHGFANTFLQLDSTYLGDGWFQYHMHVLDDPFFTSVNLSIQFDFQNQVAANSSDSSWTNYDTPPPYSYWDAGQNYQARPYDVIFLMQSTNTTYRLGTNYTISQGADVFMTLVLSDMYPGIIYSSDIVGYANMPCLVPCDPADADGSPTNYSYALKLVPDVGIQNLIETNGVPWGVDFLWDDQYTFDLQASPDMCNWTNVAYIYSTPPETLWTNNTALTNYGQFYRLEMIADGYDTNLPPVGSAVVLAQRVAPQNLAAQTTVPRVSRCHFTKGQIAVDVATQPGLNYTVTAVNTHNKILATKSVSATGSSSTVQFDARSLTTPVYFRVADVSTQ